jgi:hypothetical protein
MLEEASQGVQLSYQTRGAVEREEHAGIGTLGYRYASVPGGYDPSI